MRTNLSACLKRSIGLCLVITIVGLGASAQPANMLRFDGNDDYIECGNILPSGSYTKEVWISAGFFGSSTSNLVSGTQTAFWAPNGLIRAGHSINNAFSDVQAPVGFTMANNTWYHVAVTYDAVTNTLSLYQDGMLAASGPASEPYAETNVFIGAFNPNPLPNSAYEGRLDEVRIWNVVRTATEIANYRQCGLSGDEPGLVAHYDFEQGIPDGDNPTETTLFDRADHCSPRNGTLHNFALEGGSSNWSGPGAPTDTPCGFGFPNITVEGNNVCIDTSDASPTAADHTFFDGEASRTFTIRNTGLATLNIGSVLFTGSGAAVFSVTSPPAATVAPGASTTVTISRNATPGNHTATVNIASNDADEPLFLFDIEVSVVLPVQLIEFQALRQGLHVNLAWTTASEHDNHGFRVMRSANSSQWTSIGFVPGAGNSQSTLHYSFTDQAPMKGTNFYRLEMVDHDAQVTLSDIASVRFAGDRAVVYPVPTRDVVTIEIANPSLIGSAASISDLQGRTVIRFAIAALRQDISLQTLPAGIYLLQLGHGETHRLIKK